MRNRKVTCELRRKYKGITPEARNLRINCVSSLHYEIHVVGYNRDLLPLPIETTGIPSLRTELLALPAPGKLSVLQHHWRGSLMGTIASMKNYSRQTVSQRQEELKIVVQKSYEVRKTLNSHITHQVTDLPQDVRGRNRCLLEFSGQPGGRRYSPADWYFASKVLRSKFI